MKRWMLIAVALAVAFITQICQAQLAQQPPTPGQFNTNSTTSDYSVTEIGPHSRVWQNSFGQSVTEIATGMNYLANGQWTPSVNAFAISPDGSSFVANQIQDPTTLAANINTQGAVSAVTPNGVTLQSTPISIILYDTASGQSVVVASITNSTGVMVDAEHIVYTNAFAGGTFNASVVFSLPDTASFHQDVIFTGFDPNFNPTVWGFAASSTNTLQIQIFTEFYGTVPQPNLMERDLYIETNQDVRASMASPDFIDYTLDFGDYVFGPGRCYTLATDAGYGGVTVSKNWVTSQGRTFLIESIPFKSIAGALEALPPPQKTTASLNRPRASKKMIATAIPRLEQHQSSSGKVTKVAGLLPHGVDVDYIVTVSGTGPTVFASDTTYFVSGTVVLSGPVTMESAVFKFPTNVGTIEIESSLTLTTTNYRNAIFTSADDDSAGTTLYGIYSGYTGTNSGHKYGSVGLWLNTSANISLYNLRFCYLTTAMEINADTYQQMFSVSHTELVDCNEGIYINGGNGSNTNASVIFSLYNCLLTDLGTSCEIGGITLTNTGACNCTVDGCTNLVKVDTGTTSTGTFSFTNSIFSTLTSKGTLGSVTLTGSSNVFYNCTGATFGSYNPLTLSPYVTAGAGNYYVTNNSPYLTNGTANIPASLLPQLKMKTTQAPFWLTNTFKYSTIITPIVPRDTNGIWLGWHYDAIDFLASFVVARNQTITLTNGVALGYFQTGIDLLIGTSFYSQGTPNNRNYIAYYSGVQEQPGILGYYSYYGAAAIKPDPTGGGTFPSLSLRLTTICLPVGETYLFNTSDSDANGGLSSLTMRDCEIYGSGATWQMTEVTNSLNVDLVNNLFYRVPFAITNSATNIILNNLFYGTTNTNEFTVSIQHRTSPSPNTNQNNVYDGVSAALDGSTVGYNAYLHGAVATLGGKSSDITNNVTWQTGPLGRFYQPSGNPLLNSGSESAANLGLYHYTVLTSEAIEGLSTVSRGYHYVALTNNGTPLDYNGDGYPDYLADANGDGTNNDQEAWTGNTAAWIGVQPLNQYSVAGTPATFSVTAYGTPTVTYQWYSNGVSLGAGATSSSYTISSVTTSDAATYSVVVANSYGSATSSAVTLTVVGAPQISDYSPSTNIQYWFQQTVDDLSVTMSDYGSSTPAYYSQYLYPYLEYLSSYQWESNGTVVASGAGDPATYIPKGDAQTYTVVVSNPIGSTNLTWTNILQANPGMVENWGEDWHGESDRPVWLTNVAAIAAGKFQSIAMTDTNSVVQWGVYYSKSGRNIFYVTNYSAASAPPTSNVVAVAAGQVQGLALLANSTVYSWGLTTNEFGWNVSTQPNLSNVTAIACGDAFDLALSNGTVIAWGDNSQGETAVPAYLTNVVAIAAGGYHGLALESNGAVVSWGTVPSGSTNVPPLTNAVAIAAGYSHNLVLQSNGMVVAWGDNTYGQCTIPSAASQGNVMAIAAGDYFSMALLNNGTIVEWGDNTYGQTTVPLSNPSNPVDVRLIAAGGSHSMAGIWSSWVQYPVTVAKDLLLITNTSSVDSYNVCQYYLTHRPMVSGANILGIGCVTNEGIGCSDYPALAAQVTNWLFLNPTKRPSYVILFQDIPSRVDSNCLQASVQYQLRNNCSPGWHPFVTSINMDGNGGTTSCTNYINKLAHFGATYSPGQLIISAKVGGYGNTNWYFDDDNPQGYGQFFTNGAAAVSAVNPSASIIYTNGTDGTLAGHITNGINVAGFASWGAHGYFGGSDGVCPYVPFGTNWGYATNRTITFTGTNSGWYIIETGESFNGDQYDGDWCVPGVPQGNFISWYATNAFGGTNGSNTPVGAVSNVDEPGEPGNNSAIYFGEWAAGRILAYCAWNSDTTPYLQVVGDPFTKQ